jgi:hypothetical protein
MSMLISNYITSVRADFANVAALASDETAVLIERLASTLSPSFQKHLLDALNTVVQEHYVGNPAPLTLTVDGDEIRLTRLPANELEEPVAPSNYSARIALRLSDELKESIETLAGDVGSSVNSWIVRSLERSVRQDVPSAVFTGKRQLRGRGRA